MATADVDNDGFTDLLVGTPYEDVGSQTDSGIAQIIWGASGGLGKGKASSELTQSSFGRTVTAGDQLGYAVDTVNELGANSPMVAVGVPGGNVSGQNDAGWAGFLSAGLSDPRAIDQDSPSLPGSADAGDRFGEAITLGLLAGTSNRVDAAVGIPSEDVGSISNAGAISTIDDLYTGAVAGQIFDQETTGVPGAAENGDSFGQANDQFGGGLGFVAGVGERAFLVGVPNDVEFSSGMVNVIPLTGGSMRSWRPGAGNITLTGTDRFGAAAGGEVQQ